MPAILEVAFAVDLDVFPGEFLAQPVIAGLCRHLDCLDALGRFCFLFQENVDAKGTDIDVCDGRIRRQ